MRHNGSSFRALLTAVVFLMGCGDTAADPVVGSPADACLSVTCPHGVCAVAEGKALCACDEGYHAQQLTCVSNDVSNPCSGVTCSGHGKCSVANGKAICTCDIGYQPSGSTTCLATGGTGGSAGSGGVGGGGGMSAGGSAGSGATSTGGFAGAGATGTGGSVQPDGGVAGTCSDCTTSGPTAIGPTNDVKAINATSVAGIAFNDRDTEYGVLGRHNEQADINSPSTTVSEFWRFAYDGTPLGTKLTLSIVPAPEQFLWLGDRYYVGGSDNSAQPAKQISKMLDANGVDLGNVDLSLFRTANAKDPPNGAFTPNPQFLRRGAELFAVWLECYAWTGAPANYNGGLLGAAARDCTDAAILQQPVSSDLKPLASPERLGGSLAHIDTQAEFSVAVMPDGLWVGGQYLTFDVSIPSLPALVQGASVVRVRGANLVGKYDRPLRRDSMMIHPVSALTAMGTGALACSVMDVYNGGHDCLWIDEAGTASAPVSISGFSVTDRFRAQSLACGHVIGDNFGFAVFPDTVGTPGVTDLADDMFGPTLSLPLIHLEGGGATARWVAFQSKPNGSVQEGNGVYAKVLQQFVVRTFGCQ